MMCEEGLTNRRQIVNRLLPLRPLYANLIRKKGHLDCDDGKGLIGMVKGGSYSYNFLEKRNIFHTKIQ